MEDYRAPQFILPWDSLAAYSGHVYNSKKKLSKVNSGLKVNTQIVKKKLESANEITSLIPKNISQNRSGKLFTNASEILINNASLILFIIYYITALQTHYIANPKRY